VEDSNWAGTSPWIMEPQKKKKKFLPVFGRTVLPPFFGTELPQVGGILFIEKYDGFLPH
jgi:hypothetical protein